MSLRIVRVIPNGDPKKVQLPEKYVHRAEVIGPKLGPTLLLSIKDEYLREVIELLSQYKKQMVISNFQVESKKSSNSKETRDYLEGLKHATK